jgi:hypothetical protein
LRRPLGFLLSAQVPDRGFTGVRHLYVGFGAHEAITLRDLLPREEDQPKLLSFFHMTGIAGDYVNVVVADAAKRRQVRRLRASPVGVCSTVGFGDCSRSRSV